jgi:hypothetical protein
MRRVVYDTISVGSIQRPWSLGSIPQPLEIDGIRHLQNSAGHFVYRIILSIGVTVSASSTSGEADLPSVPQTRSRRPGG